MDAEIRKLLERVRAFTSVAVIERGGYERCVDSFSSLHADVCAALSSPEPAGTREKAEAWDALEGMLNATLTQSVSLARLNAGGRIIRLTTWVDAGSGCYQKGPRADGPDMLAAVLAATGGKAGE